MQGTQWVRRLLVTSAFLLAFVNTGCDKSSSSQGTTAAGRSSEETTPRTKRLSRSEVACRLHSCAPPYYCNEDRGVCELLPCTDSRDCPYGYRCDFSRNVCQ